MNAPDNIKATKAKAVAVELPLMAATDQAQDMTPEAARNLIINRTEEFERIFPSESAAEAVAQAVTTPAQRVDATIAKFKARGERFPEGTAGAVLCGVQDGDAEPESDDDAPDIAPDVAPQEAALRNTAEGEGGYFFGILPQREIQVSTLSDKSIEIAEISPLGSEDDARIIVNTSNAVRLARCILFAAGFQNILFAVGGPGGYEDLEDGGEAWQFEQEREGVA